MPIRFCTWWPTSWAIRINLGEVASGGESAVPSHGRIQVEVDPAVSRTDSGGRQAETAGRVLMLNSPAPAGCWYCAWPLARSVPRCPRCREDRATATLLVIVGARPPACCCVWRRAVHLAYSDPRITSGPGPSAGRPPPMATPPRAEALAADAHAATAACASLAPGINHVVTASSFAPEHGGSPVRFASSSVVVVRRQRHPDRQAEVSSSARASGWTWPPTLTLPSVATWTSSRLGRSREASSFAGRRVRRARQARIPPGRRRPDRQRCR